MASATRAELESSLTQLGRRHGWNVAADALGYYRLRFTRSDGSIAVRFGSGGRIADVCVDMRGSLHRLSLPAQARLEEILVSPAKGGGGGA